MLSTHRHGRIANRCSFDTDQIDDTLTSCLNGTVASVAWMLTAVGVMLGVAPLLGLGLAPILALFYAVQKVYRQSSVELQRLDSTSRSPVQGLLQETLGGLECVRAFGVEPQFLSRLHGLLDTNNRALWAFQVANRWLGVRFKAVGF